MTNSSEYQKDWRKHHRHRVRYLNDRSATKRFIRNSTDGDLRRVVKTASLEEWSRQNQAKLIANTFVNACLKP